MPVGAQDYVVQADVKIAQGQPKPETTVHIDNDERRDVGIQLLARFHDMNSPIVAAPEELDVAGAL